MYVYVSKEDIRASAGCQQDGAKCPIFRALHRRDASITPVDRTKVLQYGIERYRLPPIARKFIEAFDRGDAVTPIRFRIPSL
jgi:hypothetical protein